MVKSVKYVCLILLIGFCFTCGSSAPQIDINIPADGSGNPFDTLLQQQNGSLYFRFMTLNQGFTSITDVSSTAPDIWYPPLSGKGISPDDRAFNIDESILTDGVYYRVELWGKNDYNSVSFEYYGHPDCPLTGGGNSANVVTICFGNGTSVARLCSGMKSPAQCKL